VEAVVTCSTAGIPLQYRSNLQCWDEESKFRRRTFEVLDSKRSCSVDDSRCAILREVGGARRREGYRVAVVAKSDGTSKNCRSREEMNEDRIGLKV